MAQIVFLGNVIFSFPLNIYITNYVVESIIFRKMAYSECRKWLKNISRAVVVTLGILIAYFLYWMLPKILGLAGVLIGTTVVIITPALLHNRLVAESGFNKCTNYSLIVYAVAATGFLTFFIIYHWDRKAIH